MKSKLLLINAILILIMLLFNSSLFAKENTAFKLESKSSIEDNGRETHIVNHRFSTASISYENDAILDEQFDVSYVRGVNGTRADLTVKAYSLNPANKGALLYTITDKADSGEITEVAGSPFYATVKYGCCGAEEAHGLFRLDNGKLLLTYSGVLASVEIANMRYARIAAYHSNQSCIEPAGLKKGASGVFTFSTPQYNILKMIFYVEEMPEWTPTIEFIDNSTGEGSEKLSLVSGSSEKERSYYESGITLKLEFSEGEPVFIPISNGDPDLKNIKCPKNINYELLPNEILTKALQLNEEGYKLYKLKKDSEAIVKYKEAIELIEDPLFYYNYGNSLSNVSKYYEAVKAYEKALQMGYNPGYLVQYNIACAYSKLGNIIEAYRFLHLAISGGYKNFKHIAEDSDLANLRKDKSWKTWFEKEKNQKQTLEEM